MLGLPCLLCSTSSLQAPLNSRRITQKAKVPISSRSSARCRHSRNCGCRAQTRQQDSRPSPVRDAQDTELATADQQAKQDLYAQLLDRQKSGSPSEVSTSRNAGNQQTQPRSGQPDQGSTELIFRLERRGEGWGEEIFPHLVVEQRPWTTTAKRDRNRSTRPKPWTVHSLFLTAPAHMLNLTCLPYVQLLTACSHQCTICVIANKKPQHSSAAQASCKHYLTALCIHCLSTYFVVVKSWRYD